MTTFQELLRKLSHFWEKEGCIIHQGYDLEVGAGTMNPATFLRCLGPEPYRAAYIEPCRRPTDGRYGTNPNRLQHYFQYQVILKPSPLNMQDLYLDSLKTIGFDLKKHDIRFVHDDWENPTIGAWGLGWEVWMDGMEVTQYTYFQSVGGITLKPITGELTYGIERLAMYLQNVDSIFDLKWNDRLSYGDIYHRNEIEWSYYNFEKATTSMWFHHFEDFEKEAKQLIAADLPIPAYDFVMKASHAFNILDARGAISVSERTGYISRIRDLAKAIAECYVSSREKSNFPLLHRFPSIDHEKIEIPELSPALLNAQPSETTDLLLEIGSEELPATFVPIGCRNLERDITNLLRKEAIPFKEVKVFGTPRRLAVIVKDLALAIPPQVQEKKGPPIEQAYDTKGDLTAAGQGFFRSIGKIPYPAEDIRKGKEPDVEIKEIKEIPYLFATIRTPGCATSQLLVKWLPEIIINLDFPKKMRWADLEITYPRPLQWIVALLGNEVIPFAVGNLIAGRESRGHHQLNPAAFSIDNPTSYLTQLKEHYILADRKEREKAITTQLELLERSLGAHVIAREQVIPQVLDLTEWPQVTSSTFDTSFLKAPKEVLISEMVEHQKYFPVVNSQGDLMCHFVITADTNPSDAIRKGNRKVLSSRLKDGVFLYEKGLKFRLEDYDEKLKHVTFLAGFGSLLDKVVRLEKHIEILQKTLKIGNLSKAKRAAKLSKGDLASEMVYEFPDLQGIIGRCYALAQGENPEVAHAIEEQWMPRGENEPLPLTPTGTLLSLSDKIDNLICCFAAGLKPTSSSDPHALRRQALGIIKMLITGKHRLPFKQILTQCAAHFQINPANKTDTSKLIQEIEDFFVNRIKTVFQDFDFSKDEIEASVANGFTDIYDTFCKVQALHQFRRTSERFPQLFEVYKRAKGQLNNHQSQGIIVSLLKEEAEIHLYTTLSGIQTQFQQALSAHNYDQAYELVAQIQPSLAKLFDEVKILDDNPELRNNRLALLQEVFTLFSQLLDFSKIVQK